MTEYDAAIIGSGPNGLAAAARLLQAGRSVVVLEGASTVGGGTRSAQLTIPGVSHDVCSAIHPLGIASPIFAALRLDDYGLKWIQPDLPLAHPLDGGRAAVLYRSVDETAAGLGEDKSAYRRLFAPAAESFDRIAGAFLGPRIPIPTSLPVARFAMNGRRSAVSVGRGFTTGEARALWAGIAAHAIRPLDSQLSAGPGLLLGSAAHAVGWPLPRGGAQRIADALASFITKRGGEIRTDSHVRSLADLPSHRVAIFDTSARDLGAIAGDELPRAYRRKLARFKHGPGVFKVDFALDGPVPWAAEECHRAGTVHVGGTFEEIAHAEREASEGRHPDRPFVLIAQTSTFDESRAPAGTHALWTYCHAPAGSSVDMSQALESQIERFAPGFRERIIAKAVMTPADFEAYNPNYVGGDITGGALTLRQLVARPTILQPHVTPADGIYLGSSATPPGAGVHGMCGYWAAEAALKRELA